MPGARLSQPGALSVSWTPRSGCGLSQPLYPSSPSKFKEMMRVHAAGVAGQSTFRIIIRARKRQSDVKPGRSCQPINEEERPTRHRKIVIFKERRFHLHPCRSRIRRPMRSVYRMLKIFCPAVAVLVGLAGGGLSARADVVIELQVRDANGAPIETINAGDELLVLIRVKVTPDDDPLQNVTYIQFDFRGTNPGLELTNFVWRMRRAGMFNESRYERSINLPDNISAQYTSDERELGYILDLDQSFQTIARVAVIAHRTGYLTCTSTNVANPDNPAEGAIFIAGFDDDEEEFVPYDGTLQGGDIVIPVVGDDGINGDADSDGDGIADKFDKCPVVPDPDQTDTDSDGVGDACDNCPLVPNQDQKDRDKDGNGQACDPNDNSSSSNRNDNGNSNLNGNFSGNRNGNFSGNRNGNSDDGVFNDNIVDGPRNEGPPAVGGFCGTAMIGPVLFLLLGLAYRRLSVQRSSVRPARRSI